MLHDMVWDIWDGDDESSSKMLCDKFLADPNRGLNPLIRSDLELAGWKFGKTIFSIHQCPCCGVKINEDQEQEQRIKLKIELRDQLESLLDGDMDGLISEMSNIDSFVDIEK